MTAIVVALIGLVQALLWPVTVLVIVNFFREQIGGLVNRITNIKYPGGEISTQSEDPEATSAKGLEILVDSNGFYTQTGLTRLIEDSDFVQEGETVARHLLLFSTRRQHTWLLGTDRQLFCVLDDENTRGGGRLIQWRMSLSEASPIRARVSEKGKAVLDIGRKKRWLYSPELHSDPAVLEETVRRMTT